MEWKSRISQIPRGMAEKRRKCRIIPPKAEWLACLYLTNTCLATGAIAFMAKSLWQLIPEYSCNRKMRVTRVNVNGQSQRVFAASACHEHSAQALASM